VLAGGEGAVLSHRSAAALWEIGQDRSGAVEVTVPTRAGREHRPGLIIHRTGTLSTRCVTRREGIPVTTPVRTIFDLATTLPLRALERIVDEAERLRLCEPGGLAALAASHPNRPGTGAILAVLSAHLAGSTATRSELEERFLALCRERGLPAPLVNGALLGLTVDFHWPVEEVVVEVDGYASHRTRRAFQDDRDRDSLLAAHGFRTLRFTWWDVTERPAVVANRVRKVVLRKVDGTEG
jgi:hypothetical protein